MMLRYSLFLVLTVALTAFIGWGTYRTALLLRTWKPDRNLLLVPAENLLRVALVLICIGLGLLSGLPPDVLGWTWSSSLVDGLLGLVAGALLSMLMTWLAHGAVKRWGKSVYSPVVMLSVLPSGRREWILVLLALVPAVALEELLFRSLLLGGLSPILPVGLLALGLALLFGAMHLPQGVLGVAATALAGLVLAALFLWRGNIVVALVAHYTADVLQLIQAHRAGKLLPGRQ